jgi:hypothetical protein
MAAALEAAIGSIALARPKSRNFMVPSGRTLMLAGFKSRRTQVLPFDELHDKRRAFGRLLEPVNRGDVGMVEHREDFGLDA